MDGGSWWLSLSSIPSRIMSFGPNLGIGGLVPSMARHVQGQPGPAVGGGVGKSRPTSLGFAREDFEETLQVPALKIRAKDTSLYMKRMKDELLNMPRRRNVEEVQGEPESRLLLLRRDGPALTRSENGIISGLSNDALSLIKEKGGELRTHSLKIDYSSFTMEEVLRRVIPIEGDPPAAYETVGHIAHLNLRYVMDISHVSGYDFHGCFLTEFLLLLVVGGLTELN
eukprot:528087_1